MKITTFLCALCAAFIFFSCTQEKQILQPEEATFTNMPFIHDEDEDGHTNLPPVPFADALVDHEAHTSADYANPERIHVNRPDGTTETRYLVDGDIELTKEELEIMQNFDATLEKQYRTFNTVNGNNISVIGYTGGSYALTSKMRTALQWTINNYNALKIQQFSLSFAASTNADIVVYRNFQNSGAGGSAGFPSGGRPYKWVQIYAGMQNYNTNVNEHVMTHEIGHCMGLRHTDYFSRESCGLNTNEGSAGVGAVHIPGTPTDFDANSVMLACFDSGEDGEFGFYDRVALEYLY